MPVNAVNALRSSAGFQYKLSFFHKCRSPCGNCEPGQVDRFQVQGGALESTCGAPVVVVLVRYRHNPDGGFSRECQRAQLEPGAAWFAVKVIVVPTDQVLSYMDEPLLQQPRLLDSQGRNILGGPDVSVDGCIYATPLEKNGIAHLNNFCFMHPYTSQLEAAASGSCWSVGGSLQQTNRRVQATVSEAASNSGSEGRGLGGSCGVLVQQEADGGCASGELCLLVQLLRRDLKRPGGWFAYDMPHLLSRPFQVVPRSVLPALPIPGCTPIQQQQQWAGELVSAQGRSPSMQRHSTVGGFGSVSGSVGGGMRSDQQVQLLVEPQPFMSPQHKHQYSAVGQRPVHMAGFATHSAGLVLPNRTFKLGTQAGLQSREYASPGFVMGADGGPGGRIGTVAGVGGCASAGPGGVLSSGLPTIAIATGGGLSAEQSGCGGQSPLSCESLIVSGSQRGSRGHRQSCLSRDTSHDAQRTPASNGATTAVASMRSTSITSGMDPGALRYTPQGTAPLALVTVTTAAGMELGATAFGAVPGLSPLSSPFSQLDRTASLGGVMMLKRGAHRRGSGEEGQPLLPLAMRETQSAMLFDMNVSELLNGIQPQWLLSDNMMDLEEGAPKRLNSNLVTIANTAPAATTPPDAADFALGTKNNSSNYAGQPGGLQPDPVGGSSMGLNGILTTSPMDSWPAYGAFGDEFQHLRKQSTDVSGDQAGANVSSSIACAGTALEFSNGCFASDGPADTGGGNVNSGLSRASSASQLESLFQWFCQPGATLEVQDRRDQEVQQLQNQNPFLKELLYGDKAAAQPQASGGGDSMQF